MIEQNKAGFNFGLIYGEKSKVTDFDITRHTLPEINFENVASVLEKYNSYALNENKRSAISPTKLPKNARFLMGSVEEAKDYLNIKTYDEQDGKEKYVLRTIYEQFVDDYCSGHINSSQLISSAYTGIGFVFNVFDQQSMGNLKRGLKGLVCNPENYDLIKESINESMSDNERKYTIAERVNLFERTNPVLSIPEYQTDLHWGIDYIRANLPLTDFVIEDGAISAYRTLEKLWPKMNLDSQFVA